MSNNLEKLQEFHGQALLAAQKCGDRLAEGRAQNALGLIAQDQGIHREAKKRFQEALNIWHESRELAEEARTWNSLGWTHQRQQQWSKAEDCYQEALRICIEINDPGERRRSEENLANLEVGRTIDTSGQLPFESEVRDYEQDDRAQEKGVGNATPPRREGGVLFYGSSSIRFWPLLQYEFPRYPVLNRGFGGARLSDCVRLFRRLVQPYSPKVVVLYAGDNDLADGQSPKDIVDSVKKFLDLIRSNLPSTKVAFISIKPSPVRRHYQNKIEEANRLIEQFASTQDNLEFLNVYNKMLKNGLFPIEELFLDDRLHMSPKGYAIWKDKVKSYLSSVWKQPPMSDQKGISAGPKRKHVKWLSDNLDHEMELLVFGHKGTRMLVFPTWRGRFSQYEEHGMVEALRDRLESGQLQLFCVDGFDSESLYNREIPPRERILRHKKFEKYILEEVLPFSVEENDEPGSDLVVHGCSLGAFHAVNIAFRHPNRFNRVVALSGRYNLTHSFGGFRDLFDGYYDDNVYFNTPSHFIPNLTDSELLGQIRKLRITLAVGEWDAFVEINHAMKRALFDKGIWLAFRLWSGVAHDFYHWRQMIRLYT